MGSRVGILKIAAKRAGVSLDSYFVQTAAGLKWCYGCQDWHRHDAFYVDQSRYDGLSALCRAARSRQEKARYTPHPAAHHGQRPYPPRDGDKRQARQRINVEVRSGRRAHPNTLACVDCGHVWASGERRHEYDHHLGYAAEHHYTVEPVCTMCHHRREEERHG